ncbi:MAG: hypothetical protein WKF85_13295 [Chitinophagaceae bacterium]
MVKEFSPSAARNGVQFVCCLFVPKMVSEMPFKQLPKIKDVVFIKDEIAFVLNDERIVYIPL